MFVCAAVGMFGVLDQGSFGEWRAKIRSIVCNTGTTKRLYKTIPLHEMPHVIGCKLFPSVKCTTQIRFSFLFEGRYKT